jgi:hypothetical protein
MPGLQLRWKFIEAVPGVRFRSPDGTGRGAGPRGWAAAQDCLRTVVLSAADRNGGIIVRPSTDPVRLGVLSARQRPGSEPRSIQRAKVRAQESGARALHHPSHTTPVRSCPWSGLDWRHALRISGQVGSLTSQSPLQPFFDPFQISTA